MRDGVADLGGLQFLDPCGHETDLAGLAVADLGDWDMTGLDADSALARIQLAAEELPKQSVIAYVGGDNAITRPLVAGTGPLATAGVLTFDAHHDVRSLEAGPSNGNPIRGLFSDGLPDGRVAQIGIHSFANSLAYRRFCEERQVAIFTMADVDDWGIEDTVNLALQGLGDRAEWIYLDFDLDVLDVAFAPGCPGARPGGMTPRRLAAAAYMCGRHPKVRAADFVEVDPDRDHSEITLLNLANVLLAFAAGVADRPPQSR